MIKATCLHYVEVAKGHM